LPGLLLAKLSTFIWTSEITQEKAKAAKTPIQQKKKIDAKKTGKPKVFVRNKK
jgi:hypothetical protein